MSKKLNFAVEEFNFIDEDVESHFATVEIEAFSSGENRHDLTCPVELLKSTAHTLYEKPIVFELNRMMADFGSHTDDENERRIAGFIVPNRAEFFRNDFEPKYFAIFKLVPRQRPLSELAMGTRVPIRIRMGV